MAGSESGLGSRPKGGKMGQGDIDRTHGLPQDMNTLIKGGVSFGRTELVKMGHAAVWQTSDGVRLGPETIAPLVFTAKLDQLGMNKASVS